MYKCFMNIKWLIFTNNVHYGKYMYHHINMSDLCPDLKNTSFDKFPPNAVVDVYAQYVHDLVDVLDRHTLLVSRLTYKDSADWLSDFINV